MSTGRLPTRSCSSIPWRHRPVRISSGFSKHSTATSSGSGTPWSCSRRAPGTHEAPRSSPRATPARDQPGERCERRPSERGRGDHRPGRRRDRLLARGCPDARPGDALLGDGAGGVRMCPSSWLDSGGSIDSLRAELAPALELGSRAHSRVTRRAGARRRQYRPRPGFGLTRCGVGPRLRRALSRSRATLGRRVRRQRIEHGPKTLTFVREPVLDARWPRVDHLAREQTGLLERRASRCARVRGGISPTACRNSLNRLAPSTEAQRIETVHRPSRRPAARRTSSGTGAQCLQRRHAPPVPARARARAPRRATSRDGT